MQLYYDDEIGHNTSIFSDFGVSLRGGSRLKIGLRQSFATQVPTFSKLVSLIYSCWLPQKIENPGLGLLQFFKKLWRSQFTLLVLNHHYKMY